MAADTTILIDNPDLVHKINTLAERDGKPAAEIVAEAVEEKLIKDRGPRHRTLQQDAELAEILARIDALPKLGEPLTDADIYDEDGLPR